MTAPGPTPATVRNNSLGPRRYNRNAFDALTEFIRLLKKAPQEIDEYELRIRPLQLNLMAKQLYRFLLNQDVLGRIDLILPIPADPDRAAIRGYSQQEDIAKCLAAFSGIPEFHDVLVTASLRTLEHHIHTRLAQARLPAAA